MKWLILLALMASCGKYSEPAAVDLKDSDGDQVPNYRESELTKYVANFSKLGDVKGRLRFTSDKLVEIEFSNSHDLNLQTVNMITGSENQKRSERYFSEWSKVTLTRNADMTLTQVQYKLYLDFVSGTDVPNEVLLVNGKNVLKLGKWEKNMELTVAGQDLKDLIAGTAELFLVKEFENKMAVGEDAQKTIREKTYRVYFNDGENSQIFYVSKELEYDRFLELMKIEEVTEIDEDYLFFNFQQSKKIFWFSREMKDGDRVLVKNNISFLRENFLKRFTIQTKSIGRVNGKSNDLLNLMNKENAKVYLKIKGFSKTERTFTETDEVRGGGGGGREGNAAGRCNIHRRLIKGEEVRYLYPRTLEEELGPEMFSEKFIDEDTDENGNHFWQMKLNAVTPNLTLKFKSFAASTYVVTGEIKSTCDYVGSTQNTHPEGKLSLELESYVEKI